MRRRFSRAYAIIKASCFLLLLAAAVDAMGPATPPLVPQRAFRPYGYYSLVGKHPRGFENFDTIQYWQKRDEQSGPDISERLSGVIADESTHYRYATINITRQRFVFTTKRVKGVSYSFAGRFLRTDFVNAELDFDKPVLVGTLSKYRNGKKVAEANVKLSYFAGT
ncbi:MAG TPA: hypothetical protein VF553_00075 [Pyrinomonadaceae bacterium]|jgi:hypothetical protein